MKIILKIMSILFVSFLFCAPSFSLAEDDYEEGDGWIFQDGTLTITDNGGLKDFVSNDQNTPTREWKYQHSVNDVKTLVIGKDVTELANEIFDWNQIYPSNTIIEMGNPCFIVDHGWVVNTKTNTLYGAADVPLKKSLATIDDLPDYVEHIGSGAFFDYRNLTGVCIPSQVVSIGECAFYLCVAMEYLELPMAVQDIEDQAFGNCFKLREVSFGREIRSIGDFAFDSCFCLEKANIHDTKVVKISFRALCGCEMLTTVLLPETVSKIEQFAFCRCISLETLIISSSGVVIEDSIFYNNTAVKRVIFLGSMPHSFGNTLMGEVSKSQTGRCYYLDLRDMRNIPIPYPTLYYTAEYAAEWAPNGETEWNGYPIKQISQEVLDAILAQARGEAGEANAAEAIPMPAPTVAPTSTEAPALVSSPLNGWMIAAITIAVLAAGVIVVGVVKRGRK